jgi:hypothetical protein
MDSAAKNAALTAALDNVPARSSTQDEQFAQWMKVLAIKEEILKTTRRLCAHRDLEQFVEAQALFHGLAVLFGAEAKAQHELGELING